MIDTRSLISSASVEITMSEEIDLPIVNMEQKYYKHLAEMRSKAAKNSVYLTSEKYKSLVDEVSNAKKKTNKKNSRDYYLLKHFEIMMVDNKPKLICPVTEGTQILCHRL